MATTFPTETQPCRLPPLRAIRRIPGVGELMRNSLGYPEGQDVDSTNDPELPENNERAFHLAIELAFMWDSIKHLCSSSSPAFDPSWRMPGFRFCRGLVASKSVTTWNSQMFPFPKSGPFDEGSTLLTTMVSVTCNKAVTGPYALAITQVLKLNIIATPQTRWHTTSAVFPLWHQLKWSSMRLPLRQMPLL